ncbi:MAG: hypothetical protein V3T62_07670 [Alphaproteobacteria bacterium]
MHDRDKPTPGGSGIPILAIGFRPLFFMAFVHGAALLLWLARPDGERG